MTGIRGVPQYPLIPAESQWKLQSCPQPVTQFLSSSFFFFGGGGHFPHVSRVSSEHWPRTGPRRHRATSQSEAPCGQLRPRRQATSHHKARDALEPRKDSCRRLGEVLAKSPSRLSCVPLVFMYHVFTRMPGESSVSLVARVTSVERR